MSFIRELWMSIQPQRTIRRPKPLDIRKSHLDRSFRQMYAYKAFSRLLALDHFTNPVDAKGKLKRDGGH